MKKGRAELSKGVRRFERQEGERNHRFVKSWVDCRHETAHSWKNRGSEGQIEARKAEVAIEGKPAKDILSLGLLFCVLTSGDNDLSAAEVQEYLL